jgi:hypothetical protein
MIGPPGRDLTFVASALCADFEPQARRYSKSGSLCPAPEARKIIAHGETVGLAAKKTKPRQGRQKTSVKTFLSPHSGAWTVCDWVTHGFHRGLLSVAAPQLQKECSLQSGKRVLPCNLQSLFVAGTSNSDTGSRVEAGKAAKSAELQNPFSLTPMGTPFA